MRSRYSASLALNASPPAPHAHDELSRARRSSVSSRRRRPPGWSLGRSHVGQARRRRGRRARRARDAPPPRARSVRPTTHRALDDHRPRRRVSRRRFVCCATVNATSTTPVSRPSQGRPCRYRSAIVGAQRRQGLGLLKAPQAARLLPSSRDAFNTPLTARRAASFADSIVARSVVVRTCSRQPRRSSGSASRPRRPQAPRTVDVVHQQRLVVLASVPGRCTGIGVLDVGVEESTKVQLLVAQEGLAARSSGLRFS